ncbi:hypothetical protein C9439_07195 [archaeon SCG-AAA382B04]|nr:hypothetical protein C9439_07195 [archaeon SCG-AAA382B04]
MEKNPNNWTKTIGIPMEFAFSIIAFSLLGYYLGKFLLGEKGSIIGLAIGVILGFFSALKYIIKLF